MEIDSLTLKVVKTKEEPKDFWLIAMVPDGESIFYIDYSTHASDVLQNGNWEDDCLILPANDLDPGVYKFRLIPRGGRDNYDPYDYWAETEMIVEKVIWEYKLSWWAKLKGFFKCCLTKN